MSIGYPHLGGYPSGYPTGKGKGDMYDGDGGRGYMGGPGMGGGGGSGPGPTSGARIMVSNINEKISRLDLEEKFSKYGKVTGIQMQGSSAYLLFDREDSAIQAARLEHAVFFKGARIEVCVAPEKSMGGGSGGGGMGRGLPGSRGDGGGGADSGGRMGPMGRSGRSPSGFRDRPQGMMGGREDRFRDDMPGIGYDEPFNKGFNRGMDGEPYAKNPRYDPYMGGNFGRNEPGMPPPPPVDPYLDPYNKGGPPVPDPRKPNDCEIIVIHKNQQSYAESVEQRLRNLGLTVDLLFLREEGALTHTVDDIGRRGTLFAVVIAQQHEVHGSLTLNILQGNPQEHRNMPLDDALKLIARSFHEFVQTKKKNTTSSGGIPPPPMDREIRLILTLLLEGKYVTSNELERTITYLKERRERLLGDAAALQSRTATTKPAEEPSGKAVPAEQQDLQQRILNILGSGGSANSSDMNMANTVANPLSSASGPMGMPGFNDLPLSMIGAGQQQQPPGLQQQQPQQSQQQQSPSSNTYINFDNPSVQKALDSLIQSGPNLLKNINMANSPTGNPRGPGPGPGPGPQQKPQGMMGNVSGGFNQGYGGPGPGNIGGNVNVGGGGGMQSGYRHPGNNSNNMMGGRPQQGGPNNQGGPGFGMGRQMRY